MNLGTRDDIVKRRLAILNVMADGKVRTPGEVYDLIEKPHRHYVTLSSDMNTALVKAGAITKATFGEYVITEAGKKFVKESRQ